jgi:hypothetical protein
VCNPNLRQARKIADRKGINSRGPFHAGNYKYIGRSFAGFNFNPSYAAAPKNRLSAVIED